MEQWDYSDYYEASTCIKTTAWSLIEKRIVPISEGIIRRGDLAPYIDMDSNEEVTPRKCWDRRDHYSFKPIETPIVSKKESALHLSCKEEICSTLIERIPNGKWEMERPIGKSLRPDISGRIFKNGIENGIPVVIEVQASTLTIDKVIKRTKEYTKKGCYILWVLPLISPLEKDEYRPRLMEAYFHCMYFGRIYYWIQGMGSKVIPVHYETAYREIDSSFWYDESGEEITAGGYTKPYKYIKKLNRNNPIDLIDHFKADFRDSFLPKSRVKYIPECKLFRDNQPGWW